MTLEDIYNQLAYGELRLLSIGGGNIDSPQEGFPVESFIKMFPTIQLGLTELYKQFSLKEGTITVPLSENKVTYVLRRGMDAPVTFSENLLKVERIYGRYRQKKYEIPLNRLGCKEAIRTTSYDTLLIPDNVADAPWLKETTELTVTYRADHPKIRAAVASSAPLAVNIELPVTHLQALLYFIASRMHNPVGMTNEFHDGNNYAAKYENELMKLQMMNYEIDDDAVNDRILAHGWV